MKKGYLTFFFPCLMAMGLTWSCQQDDAIVAVPEHFTPEFDLGEAEAILEKQYVVRFKPVLGLRQADPAERMQLVDQQIEALTDRLSAKASVKAAFYHAFQGMVAQLEPEDVRQLQELDLEVEPDEVWKLDLPRPEKTLVPRSGELESWGVTFVNGPVDGTGKTAWVLDTGVDQDHPDLNVDTRRSRSFLPWFYYEWGADDLGGHGTHVAGIIGAKDNEIGITGIAAGATIVGIKVLSLRGFGTLSTILQGIDYVVENAEAGDVMNISLGGKSSFIIDWVIEDAASRGITVVAAAGNNSRDVGNISPARVEAPNVFTVSAMDQNGRFADFSNFGLPVDFAAPGVSITSTYSGGGYATLTGTSAAAPHIAGILLVKDRAEVVELGKVFSDPDGRPDAVLGFAR